MRPKFAIVREDPNVELEVSARVSARAVLTVASGGCTALSLAHQRPELAVTAFDMSSIQLEHVQKKREAVARGDLAALNVGDASSRALNQCGEFEGLFRTLRAFVEEFVAPPAELRRFFAGEREVSARWFSSRYWKVAFEVAFHDSLLHAMFGPAATQHAEQGSYPGYFQRAFERGLGRDDAQRNPFLRHVLLGDYEAEHAPSYVHAGRALPLDLVEGTLLEVPELGRFDVISLSNIFDWSDDALVESWARTLRENSKPGSAVVVRQLNNRRDVRRFFGDRYEFDDALGEALTRADRSLFYERIEIGYRR